MRSVSVPFQAESIAYTERALMAVVSAAKTAMLWSFSVEPRGIYKFRQNNAAVV
jgi:hypothetical protein